MTPVIDAPAMLPVVVRTKSALSTPVTVSLKVTVKSTLAAAVGFVLARMMLETVGAVLSMV